MNGSLFMVQLAVADWARATAWYTGALGLKLLLCDEAGRFALLSAGTVRLALKEGATVASGALLAFEVADVDGEVVRLEAQGVAPDGPVRDSPEGYREAIFRDPDGHRLSLFQWVRQPGLEMRSTLR